MATKEGRGKILLAAFDGPTATTPYRRTDLANIFSRNRVIAHFVPNFVAVATRECWGKISLAAFYGLTSKIPYKRKNLADISYKSQVIVHFVSNFVAMATRESPE